DIVVIGRSPHWKFQKYDLKYLKDPKGSFGEAEHINTMARKDLKKDSLKAYEILDNFNWKTKDVEEVMLDIQEDTSPKKASAKLVDDNQYKAKEWTKESDSDK